MHSNYNLYKKFIETFAPTGFKNIDPNHPLLLELERFSETHNQFFHVADLVLAKIMWASNRSETMMGIKPDELNAYHFMEATHPDDLEKHTRGRSKMFDLANDLFKAKTGETLLSINIRIRNAQGQFPDLLFQLYFFYSEVFKTVFLLQVHTNIDNYPKRKNGYHYYVGNDFSNFRFPDNDLLAVGNPSSDCEFRIVELIEKGKDSEDIAKQLFRSVHTINTHRRNILNKTGKKNMSELIGDFKSKRLL